MRSLRLEGVDTIFGYPGGNIMPVYDSVYTYTRGEKKCFNHILVRHEQAAAHAAEGFRTCEWKGWGMSGDKWSLELQIRLLELLMR
jgi:thiamine pyrophosphate-dependent acetolactate synthase large subunit-like protein